MTELPYRVLENDRTDTRPPSDPEEPSRPESQPARAGLLSALAAMVLQACGGGGSDGGGSAGAGTAAAGAATGGGTTAAGGGAATAGSGSSAATATATSTTASGGAASATVTAGNAANGSTVGATAGPRYPVANSDAEAARFLLQAQFSASDEEIARVRSLGYGPWLTAQFNATSGIGAWDWLNQRGYAAIDSARYYDNTYPGDFALWYQLFNAPDAMRKRVALALSEIFVVSLSGLDVSWRSHMIASYFDTLSANAFGSFRALLEQVTLHPAMGVYLNTRGNQKENAAGRQPDENYAREVMQLMTIGPVRLNADGTPQRDANGATIDSYAQADVTNLARVFTGWDFDQSQNVPFNDATQGNRSIPSTHFARLPMSYTASRHSTLDANFLGTTVSGTTPGPQAMAQALDTLVAHPNTAPFISRQLIQRLVTSNPSPGYVARVAAAFADNGIGQRGDLAAVVMAILLDDEARAPAGLADNAFGRVREPMLRLAQWGRTFGLASARGTWKLGDLSDPASRLGQSPMRSPSVFNFFRPGYVPPSTAIADRGLVAPEFQLVNESSVGGYLNFMQGVLRNGIFIGAPDQPQSGSNGTNGYDLTAAYTRELALIADTNALVARICMLLAADQVSAGSRALIAGALDAAPLTYDPNATPARRLDRIAAAVLMVMASPEYLVQK